MSDLHHPCERWAEPISLAAAGCLSPDEDKAVREHLETCPDCREQFRQLTELCRVLTESPSGVDGKEASAVERILSAITADVARAPVVRRQEEMIHSPSRSQYPDFRSWIMRSPVPRISAAAFLVLAIGAITLWFSGGGARPAYADLIDPILNAKTVTFKSTAEVNGQKSVGKIMAITSLERVRVEHELPGGQKMVTISDANGSITLQPVQKVAIVTTVTNAPKEKRPKSIFFELRSQLAETRNNSDWIREPLGEKEFDGRKLVGFRLIGRGLIWELWGDRKTGMPVRIESSSPAVATNKPLIYSDFVFDVDLDESLFSMDPPAGYQVHKQTMDVTPAEEKDLVETIRGYAKLNGGTFPDKLDMQNFMKLYLEDREKTHPKSTNPSEAERQELLNGMLKLSRGFTFAFEQLPRDAEARYAGKGIKLDTADAPIFWYRNGDTKKYRVIYADLSARDAETAPTVPNAEPVISAAGQKK